MLRTCMDCGQTFPAKGDRDRYCPEHERHGVQHRSPTTRAQNAEYKRERARILAGHPTCHWCGQPATTVDHLVAVANGGAHRGNLVPACARCNFSRQDRPAPSSAPSAPAAAPPTPRNFPGAIRLA